MTALHFIIDEESRMSEMIPGDMYPLIEGLLIDFAKLKVQEAKQAICGNMQLVFCPADEEVWFSREIDKEDILDFYRDGDGDDDFAISEFKQRPGFSILVDANSIVEAYPLTNIM